MKHYNSIIIIIALICIVNQIGSNVSLSPYTQCDPQVLGLIFFLNNRTRAIYRPTH